MTSIPRQQTPPHKILMVHQSAELYGSDQMFIHSVRAMRDQFPKAEITVEVPFAGPMIAEIQESASHIRVRPMWVLRKASFSWRALLRFWFGPWAVLCAVWRLWRDRPNLIYINTVVVMDTLFASFLAPKKAQIIVHAHEIAPPLVCRVFHYIYRLFGRLKQFSLIANSRATALAYNLSSWPNTHLVLNGQHDIAEDALSMIQKSDSAPLNLLMLGRLYPRKGQGQLLEALSYLTIEEQKSCALRIVGDSVPGQTEFETTLHSQAVNADIAAASISFYPFSPRVEKHYQWADVVIFPSTEPESFGLVPVEAMSCSRPVIATDLGGVPEVVVDQETGILVKPDDPKALARAIRSYLRHPKYMVQHGIAGRVRYDSLFTLEHYRDRFKQAIASILGLRTPPKIKSARDEGNWQKPEPWYKNAPDKAA